MAQFTWDKSYSVSVKRFDDDHQKLFHIINELHDGIMARRGQDILQTVLAELLQYTEYHFSGEESVMRTAGYPQLQMQIEQHRKFTNKIREVAEQYKAGKLALSLETLTFLTNWLKQHIVGLDKQYSQFLNAKGIA